MRSLIGAIAVALSRGENAVLLTVLKREGSAPRSAGACMLALSDGGTHGTIGGGAMEHEALTQAKLCLSSGRSALLSYKLSPSQAGDIGMVCGGDVLVHCWLLSPDMQKLFETLASAVSEERDIWLERVISIDGSVLSANALTDCDYETTKLMQCAYGTDSNASNDKNANTDCSAIEANVNSSKHVAYRFIEPVMLASHAYVFGGGHIAVELVPLLDRLEFSPVVFDDRLEFANDERFPDAQRVVVGDFNHISDYTQVSSRDSIVIMTRGHSYDNALLKQALRTDAAYIGLIGSRSKIARTKALLFEQGFTEADFARVHTPIGLPIQAETPAEIAVSIAAQMILKRAEARKGLA